MKTINPCVLLVLDGWGISHKFEGNAIKQAQLHHYPNLLKHYPNAELLAAGEAVGLPHEEDGNSEVGHINLGAGRIVIQDLTRINKEIQSYDFEKNKELNNVIQHVQKKQTNLHLLGLVSDSGVHASISHLKAIIDSISKQKIVTPTFVHLFTDGRDSPPQSGKHFLSEIQAYLEYKDVGIIATVVGRYFAMDRDLRWSRTEVAYNALTKGEGTTTEKDAKTAVIEAYKKGRTFLVPLPHDAPPK